MTEIQQYLAPTTVEQAVECLQQVGEVTILAGGTDLMPQKNAGRLKPQRTLMNIRGIAELRGIAQSAGELHIGALATIAELLDDPRVQRHLPALAEACDHFASDQIRNVATLGGNICNASPAGDTLVPLLVFDARVDLVSRLDDKLFKRSIPIGEFFIGPGKTRRSPGELVAGVSIPLPPENHLSRFFKFGARPALDIATISIGFGAMLQDGVLSKVHVAFGAVAATPVRAFHTEAALEGKRLDAATIAAAASIARDEVTPIDDVRGSAWYRKEMIHNMTKRILDHVADA